MARKSDNPYEHANNDIERLRSNPGGLDSNRKQDISGHGSNKRPVLEKRDEIPSQRRAPRPKDVD